LGDGSESQLPEKRQFRRYLAPFVAYGRVCK
jgi:hypothetical protein